MIIRQVRLFALSVGVIATLVGCAPAEEPGEPVAAETASSTPTATATAAPEPDPLLVISGSVTDQEGQSLEITLTTISVRVPTDADRADFAATRCAVADPAYQPLVSPDARVVTMSVDAVASPGFAGWSDERGVLVGGSLFDGPIWEPEAHGTGAACYQDSRITRPGTGDVRVFASSDDWNIAKPVAGDGAITLAVYGMNAQSVDALGQPTGLTEIADCVTAPSAEFDALAQGVWDAPWERNQNLPEYCFYGRNAGD